METDRIGRRVVASATINHAHEDRRLRLLLVEAGEGEDMLYRWVSAEPDPNAEEDPPDAGVSRRTIGDAIGAACYAWGGQGWDLEIASVATVMAQLDGESRP